MIHKKLVFTLLSVSLISTGTIRASEVTDKIKVGSALAGGLAAGAAVGKFMPGPLPAKIVAGAATTVLVTPGLLLTSLRKAEPIHWELVDKYASIAHFYGSPIAAALLGITAGICIGKVIPASLAVKILAGASIATGITTAGLGLWVAMTVLAGAMSGSTARAG